MAQPDFYSEGAEPLRDDVKLRTYKKWLGELRDLGQGTPDEDPKRLDTIRQTQQKILKCQLTS